MPVGSTQTHKLKKPEKGQKEMSDYKCQRKMWRQKFCFNKVKAHIKCFLNPIAFSQTISKNRSAI